MLSLEDGFAIEFLARHLLDDAGHAEVSTDSNLQEKTEEEEFSIGPLSVLYNSVKSNSQARLRIGKLILAFWHVRLLVCYF